MIKNKKTLYTKDKKGSIIFWRIWSEDDTIFFEFGRTDGESQLDSERVTEGLQSRTVAEQIKSRIDSRVNKKCDSGYTESLEDAISGERRNALGYKRPAKCSRYDKRQKHFVYGGDEIYGIQTKLDGHHASVVNDNGKLVMFSSNGKIIDTVPEILEGLNIPVGRTIEGELYHHGTLLQTISSWVKRKQPDTDKLKFHVYDMDGEECYSERHRKLIECNFSGRVVLHETTWTTLRSEEEMLSYLKTSLDNKFEGLVIRLMNYNHVDGNTSNGMIKVKPMHFKEFAIDDEFLVVNILRSVDGWARLVCVTESGDQFKCSAPGTVEEKTEVLRHKAFYIGKHVRITFAGYTKAKKPFHPVATMWREKNEE